MFTDDYKWVKSQIFKDAEHIEINNNNLKIKRLYLKLFQKCQTMKIISQPIQHLAGGSGIESNKDLIKIVQIIF